MIIFLNVNFFKILLFLNFKFFFKLLQQIKGILTDVE